MIYPNSPPLSPGDENIPFISRERPHPQPRDTDGALSPGSRTKITGSYAWDTHRSVVGPLGGSTQASQAVQIGESERAGNFVRVRGRLWVSRSIQVGWCPKVSVTPLLPATRTKFVRDTRPNPPAHRDPPRPRQRSSGIIPSSTRDHPDVPRSHPPGACWTAVLTSARSAMAVSRPPCSGTGPETAKRGRACRS